MDIVFRDARLRKTCNERTRAVRRFGPDCAKILMRRLDDLRAAEALADMRDVPGRCHELRADRAGQLALDLRHPKRLVFEPANDPVPRTPGGNLDWGRVTALTILEVVDYHG